MKKQIVSLISLSIVLSSVAINAQQKRDSLKEKTIDEVVLVNVGYGTQKKTTVTGAISKVTSKDLEKTPNGGVGQMIQGRASGVTVAMNSGAPGSGATVRVRGITTFGGANDPLWIVDGVPVESSDIASLNQADVESMEVLKDAASAAIYGTRAAKGVILITTKKGKKGRISVAYNGYTSYSSPSKVLKLLNATEYGALMNEKSINGGGSPIFTDISSLGAGTDWQKQVFNKSAFGMNHELSFSGGNEVSDFYVSFGLQDQDGIVATDISKYSKKTARVNSNHKFLNIFTFGENLFYTHQTSTGMGNVNSEFGGVLSDAIMFDPTVPVVEKDPIKANSAPYTSSAYIVRDQYGNPYGMSSLVGQEIVNPVAYIQTQLGNTNWSDVIIGNTYLQAEPIKGLKIKTTLGGKKAFWGSQGFSPLYYLNQYTSNVVKNTLSRGTGNGFDWYVENTINYDKQLGDHNFSILLGQGAYTYGIGNYVSASHSSLPTNNWWQASFNMDVPETEKRGYSYNSVPIKRTSLFARINYNYKEKYIFSGIVRRDGSSLFGPNEKYGIFPSASLGWVVSKENFWPQNKVLNTLKIRAGYGVNGNDGTLAPNQYESLITGGYNYTLGSQIYIGNAPATLSNPNLHWEETTQQNFGIDAKLFNNFNLTAEYYKKQTSGILRQYVIPGYVGVTDQPWGNVADMDNEGLELELSYRKTFGNDLTFSASANFATLKNTITNLGDVEFYEEQGFQSMQGALTRLEVGHPYGSFYGYKTNGIFQNWSEINSYVNSTGGLIQPNAKPGDFRWTDVNGDGSIDANDRTFLGNSLPKYTFGLTLNLDYKNFDLSAFFQGAAGNKIFQGLRRLDIANANYQTVALSRWTGEGTSNDYPRLTTDDANGNFSRMSDFYLQDGSYVRLKLLSLGYSIPKSLVQSIHAEKIRIYVSGSNLITFTKYTGYDPEIGGSVMGIDRGYYPQPRTFIFGVNLQF